MNRQSVTKTQKPKNSTLLPATDILQRKTINRADFGASIVDTWSPSGQQINESGLPGVGSLFSPDFSKIPVRLNSPYPIQAKLKIGQPNDKYEKEADRVAEQVMRMPDPGLPSSVNDSSLANGATSHIGTIQRASARHSVEYKMAEDESRSVEPVSHHLKSWVQKQGLLQTEQITPLIQAKKNGNKTPEVTPTISFAIQSLQGGGQPLSGSERGFFEPRIGADFSNVRIHNYTRAANVARSVNARAFTLGHNVVFGAGEHSSDSFARRKLLAHELTHVVQQDNRPTIFSKDKNSKNTVLNSQALSAVSPGLQRTIGDGHDLTAPWLAGDAVLEAIYDDERVMQNGSTGTAVKKVQQLLFYLGTDFPLHGADGIFGGETETAVKAFQRANVDEAGTQLVDDGIVGPLTMGALNREANQTGTEVNGLTRTTPIAALQGPSTATPPPLSVDRIDIVDSPAGAIGGYPAILGNASLNTPGPFNDPTEVKNVHQIHFHLDNGSSADLTPLREVRATFTRSGAAPARFPPDQSLPPGVVGPPTPGGFTGVLIQNDGPPIHEIQRPTADTLAVADAPGPRGLVPAQFPVTMQAHFIFTVNDTRNAPVARINYDVFIDRRSVADVPNTDNRIVSVAKRDFVRGKNL